MPVERITLTIAAILCLVVLGYLAIVLRKETRRSDDVGGQLEDAKDRSEQMLSALHDHTKVLKEIKELLEKK